MNGLLPTTSFNFSHFLRRLEKSSYVSADRIALRFLDETFTYGELRDRAARLASALARDGFVRGERVAILLKNDPAWFDAFFAVAALGGVLVPINFFLRDREIAFILNDSGASTLIVGFEYADVAARALEDAAHCPRVLLVNKEINDLTTDVRALPAAMELSQFADVSDPSFPDIGTDMGEPALIQYTSGTTGFPKGATHTVASLMWNSFHQIGDFQITEDERYLCVPSLCWIAGLHDFTLATLWVGGRVILNPSGGLSIDKVLDTLAREKITTVLLVPTILKQLVEFADLSSRDLSCLKTIFTGGEPVPVPVIERFRQRLPSVNLIQGYGLSEGPSIATALRPDTAFEQVGSCGKALTNCELRVVDDDDRDMGSGETGEVILRSPATMAGYWNREDATREVLRNGWLHTGDLGSIDETGYLRITGRKKDMFISGGLNVYPAEIESTIIRDENVAECAVIAQPDERWGEVGLAVIVAKPGQKLELGKLEQACAAAAKGEYYEREAALDA